MNPASTVLLAEHTPVRLRSRIFSLKQTAVPAGGALAGSAMPIAAALLGWRVTMVSIAVVCSALAVLIQPWRTGLDRSRSPGARLVDTGFWLPAKVLSEPGLRGVAVASFAFGAVQFSFSAVFPTVLASEGWSVKGAGLVLSTALAIGVACRILWGSVADRLGSRPILGTLGVGMGIAAVTATFLTPDWPALAVMGLAALFGVSAYCWAGIGLAETVHRAPPGLISEASAGMIALTFLGALAGPALFSTTTVLTGSFRPAFLILGTATIVSGAVLLRPLSTSA